MYEHFYLLLSHKFNFSQICYCNYNNDTKNGYEFMVSRFAG